MHIALHGQTDAVILTGGIAFNDYCVQGLREWLEGLAPIVVIPGEDEMGALAMKCLGSAARRIDVCRSMRPKPHQINNTMRLSSK